ncbi:MAG: hypothetical protein V3T84_16910 [Phycisphaerales bacterium]
MKKLRTIAMVLGIVVLMTVFAAGCSSRADNETGDIGTSSPENPGDGGNGQDSTSSPEDP